MPKNVSPAATVCVRARDEDDELELDPVRPPVPLLLAEVDDDPFRPPVVVVLVDDDPLRPFVLVLADADPVRPPVPADCPLRRAPAVSRAAGRGAVDAVSRRVRFVVADAVSRRAGRLPDALAVSRRAVEPDATRWPVPARAVSRRAESDAAGRAARPSSHTTSPRGGRAAVSPLDCTENGPVPPAREYGPERGFTGTVSASASSSPREEVRASSSAASSSSSSYSAIVMLSPDAGRVVPKRSVSAGGRRWPVCAAAGSAAASDVAKSSRSERLRMVRAGAWAGSAARAGL